MLEIIVTVENLYFIITRKSASFISLFLYDILDFLYIQTYFFSFLYKIIYTE